MSILNIIEQHGYLDSAKSHKKQRAENIIFLFKIWCFPSFSVYSRVTTTTNNVENIYNYIFHNNVFYNLHANSGILRYY